MKEISAELLCITQLFDRAKKRSSPTLLIESYLLVDNRSLLVRFASCRNTCISTDSGLLRSSLTPDELRSNPVDQILSFNMLLDSSFALEGDVNERLTDFSLSNRVEHCAEYMFCRTPFSSWFKG